MNIKNILIFSILAASSLFLIYSRFETPAGTGGGAVNGSTGGEKAGNGIAIGTQPVAVVSPKTDFNENNKMPDYPLKEKAAEMKDGEKITIKGKIRLVGAGKSRDFVLTTSGNFDVTVITDKDGFDRLMKYQGRQATVAGKLSVRELKYPNPVYDRTVFSIEPESIGF